MSRILNKNKVVLGLSGGVDSTTAALLLSKQGFEVTGLFFDINETGRPTDEKPMAAKRLAEKLNIDFIYKNLSKDFSKIVIGNFCDEYCNGRTPNPCIICNPNVKFKCLVDAADSIGAYHIATGHYAQKTFIEELNSYHIVKGKNVSKDQSYMLYRLPSEIVERLIFPLGEMSDKSIVRGIARENKMPNSETVDSQELCFVSPNEKYTHVLANRNVENKQGNFIDLEGNILGRHKGILNYTVGQRKGLGITFGEPKYVVKIDGNTGDIVLGNLNNLYSTKVLACDCFFPTTGSKKIPDFLYDISLEGKIRYNSKSSLCHIISYDEGILEVKFEVEQKSITPGQSIVLYYKDAVVGGGFIK